ncbi:hypothetical protein pb186bvf_009491 [Paramecium bursaria]
MIDQGVFKENNRLIFKDDESVQKLAEKKDRTLVIFEDNVYDVTDFLDRHPGNYSQLLQNQKGGSSILEDYCGYDISEAMNDTRIHKHTKSAFQQMNQYFIGKIDEEQFKVFQNQTEVKTDTLINYGAFQIDQIYSILQQITRLTDDQYEFVCSKPSEQVYVPRFNIQEEIRNTITFEDHPVKEKALWISRNKVFQIECTLGILLLIIFFIMNYKSLSWIYAIVATIGILFDYRWLLKLIKFSDRNLQFRFYQRAFPIKEYVTIYWFYAELSIVILYIVPYVKLFVVLQIIIMGLQNRKLYNMTDEEFLKNI